MDAYTKFILTVIAVALSVIALRSEVTPANAQLFAEGGCGTSRFDPCYVEISNQPIRVLQQ